MQNQDDLFQLSPSGAGEGTASRQGSSSMQREGQGARVKASVEVQWEENPFPEPAHAPGLLMVFCNGSWPL